MEAKFLSGLFGNWSPLYLLCWFLGSYLYHGLGITLGYHRLLTHKAVTVPRWLMYLIVSGGYLCLQGSPVVWVGVHRLHHQKSDIPGQDPHTPRDGFKHALYGWMFNMSAIQTDEELQAQCRDLMKDPVLRGLGDSHTAEQAMLCLKVCLAARAVIWIFFGLGAVLANLLATWMVFWSTQLVNAICHYPGYGYKLFNTKDDSLNVWWVGILALGEGWHNNHHAAPTSARHGIAWWEVDVTWMAIWIIEKLGLGSKVVRFPARMLQTREVPVEVESEMPVLEEVGPRR